MSSKDQNVLKVEEEVKYSEMSVHEDTDDLTSALEHESPQQTPTKQQIHRVPKSTVEVTEDFEKYYLPKVVSIGPYHFGEPGLKPIQDLKLAFASDLFSGEGKNKRLALYHNLQDSTLLQKLRSSYDAENVKKLSDRVFGNIMFLDGCFILYYILLSCGHHFETKGRLLNHQMISIRQDLFLLENQIPFQVLDMVMKQMKEDCEKSLYQFIVESTFSSSSSMMTGSGRNFNYKNYEVHHLLQLLRLSLTIDCKDAANSPSPSPSSSADMSDNQKQHMQHALLPTVKELYDAGIRFKKNNTASLCQIGFSNHWWQVLRATVKLPPIIVEEASTKYLFLNLMAYEASSHKSNDMWVTSYICLLNSLIGKSEDVKALRDAEVFANSQGSDDDIRTVIKEIAAAGRAPDNLAYLDDKIKIRRFYDQVARFNKPFSEFKDKYFNSPWSVLALAGAILALFLTAVQTYFTVWSLKGECDDLCNFLKLNHHL